MGGAFEFFYVDRYHGDASALGKGRSVRCRHLLQERYNTDLPDPSVVAVQWTKTKSGFGRFVDHSWGHLRNKPSKQTGNIDRLPRQQPALAETGRSQPRN